MKTYLLLSLLFIIIQIKSSYADICGCRTLRPCYKYMVDSLKDKDEEACIEDASVGISTIEVFLKAIKKYCPDYISIVEEDCTYESRHLYEVILNITTKEDMMKAKNRKLPVIMIDAGQQADEESVGLALFVIEQLIACEENNEMLKNVKWVILPSTNPDGLMHAGNNRKSWKKNMRPSEDGLSFGVDISRNFPSQWDGCAGQENGFSPNFPVKIQHNFASLCGCKAVRDCYKDMVDTLQDRDEEACVEDSSIGVSTVLVYLKALKQFCPEYITVIEDSLTYEGRHLYEVILTKPIPDEKKNEEKPVILIDAGQQAGTESVGMALFLIEQLVACEEYNDMLTKVKWVILPSVNPDGMEYGRYNRVSWRKNLKPSEDGLSFGVDISRNFDYEWNTCEVSDSGFSPDFPGLNAASENETIFIKNSLSQHKKHLKLYLSIRRDGHGIFFPYAYTKKYVTGNANLLKHAADVSAKVNQRAGGVQVFLNESIYEGNGKPVCGNSVDYAYNAGVPLAYEMRVFLGHNKRFLSKFQTLPRGYEVSLRLGYFVGIKEFYNKIASDKKFLKLF